MVYQNLPFLEDYFDARAQLEEFENLFVRRTQGENVRLSPTLEASLIDGNLPVHSRIRETIGRWKDIQLKKIETDLLYQSNRLIVAEKKLQTRPTRSAEKEKAVAERQIKRLITKRDELSQSQAPSNQGRIFPFDFTPVLIEEKGKRILLPMRYHLRPPGMREDFDRKYPGCYNARRDQLLGFWNREFGKKHAALLISSFYENVTLHIYEKRSLNQDETEKNQIIRFKTEGLKPMLISCLYDRWEGQSSSLLSFAILTDEPPAEVSETGHDRCPILLKEGHLDQWLNPAERSSSELFSLLEDKDAVKYVHEKTI